MLSLFLNTLNAAYDAQSPSKETMSPNSSVGYLSPMNATPSENSSTVVSTLKKRFTPPPIVIDQPFQIQESPIRNYDCQNETFEEAIISVFKKEGIDIDLQRIEVNGMMHGQTWIANNRENGEKFFIKGAGREVLIAADKDTVMRPIGSVNAKAYATARNLQAAYRAVFCLARIRNVYEQEKTYFDVFPYVGGTTMQSLIEKNIWGKAPAFQELVNLMQEAGNAAALYALYQLQENPNQTGNIGHQDCHPDNIMVPIALIDVLPNGRATDQDVLKIDSSFTNLLNIIMKKANIRNGQKEHGTTVLFEILAGNFAKSRLDTLVLAFLDRYEQVVKDSNQGISQCIAYVRKIRTTGQTMSTHPNETSLSIITGKRIGTTLHRQISNKEFHELPATVSFDNTSRALNFEDADMYDMTA